MFMIKSCFSISAPYDRADSILMPDLRGSNGVLIVKKSDRVGAEVIFGGCSLPDSRLPSRESEWAGMTGYIRATFRKPLIDNKVRLVDSRRKLGRVLAHRYADHGSSPTEAQIPGLKLGFASS